MDNKQSAIAQNEAPETDVSVQDNSVVTKDAQIDGTPTRSKRDCFMATLSRLEKSSFDPFRELVEAIYVWIESQDSDMHRGQPRLNALSEFVTAEFLYSDVMLQKRSKISYTLILSAIKLFTSVPVEEGPAHPVKRHCAKFLYGNDKVEYAFASSQIERHEAISESEMRKIFKRNEDNLLRLSEEGMNITPVLNPTQRSTNEVDEKAQKHDSQGSLSTHNNIQNLNAVVEPNGITLVNTTDGTWTGKGV